MENCFKITERKKRIACIYCKKQYFCFYEDGREEKYQDLAIFSHIYPSKDIEIISKIMIKANLLQLNHTQFPSLRIFVSKKSWKIEKTTTTFIICISFKSCILGGLSFFEIQLFY